jgi:hypothetical protein
MVGWIVQLLVFMYFCGDIFLFGSWGSGWEHWTLNKKFKFKFKVGWEGVLWGIRAKGDKSSCYLKCVLFR